MITMKTLHKINLLIVTSVMMVAVTISSSENLSAKTVKTQKTTLTPASSNNCQVKQQEFRRLYLELQAKYLNYEGKDTTFDSKGNIVLVPHKEGAPYEGKEFEEAIFKEYLNSISKVAKLFQDATFRPDVSAPNKKLLDFLKSIDDNENTFINDTSKEIADIVEMLYQESNKKYKSGPDAKYALTERDKYLLKKLVTHAQDRICSVNHYDKTRGKGSTKYFTNSELHKQMNAPLNRIMYAIREAKISEKDRIVLYEPEQLMVNGKEAVHSAIKAHINDIAKFVRDNKRCMEYFKNHKIIQKNIQPCNYQRFLESLERGPAEFSELESILHFINANDQFMDYGKKQAETDLDPELLEMRTRLRLQREDDDDIVSTQLACSKIKNDKGEEAIFLRNMPSKPGTVDEPDTSIIECFDAKSNHQLDAQACQKLIKVEVDPIGRGLVVKTVEEKNSGRYKFSIKEKPECSQVINNDLTGPNTDLITDNKPPTEEANKCPSGKPRNEKGECPPVTLESCTEQGLILNPEKTECIKDPNANTCPEGKVCPETTTPPADNVVNQCDPKCTTPGFSCNKTTNKCEQDPQTNNTCTDKQEWKANQDGKGGQCVDKPANNKDDEAECEKKNADWSQKMLNDGEGASKRDGFKKRFEWKDGKCNDTLDERKPKKETAAAPIEKLNLVDGPAPARFTPIQIPQRRFYVLPGMP